MCLVSSETRIWDLRIHLREGWVMGFRPLQFTTPTLRVICPPDLCIMCKAWNAELHKRADKHIRLGATFDFLLVGLPSVYSRHPYEAGRQEG